MKNNLFSLLFVSILLFGFGCSNQPSVTESAAVPSTTSSHTSILEVISAPTAVIPASTISPEWKKVAPQLPKILGPIFKKDSVQIGRSAPLAIQGTLDLTGDGFPEALVFLGDGGASTQFVTIVQLIDGKPEPLLFSDSKNTTGTPRFFVTGASVMHGDEMMFFTNGFSIGSWQRQDDGTIATCSVVTYVWNNTRFVMRRDTILSNFVEENYCRSQRANNKT